MVCSGIDLNHRLGSLVVRVVCGAFCLGGGSWVRGVVLLGFLRGFRILFLKRFIELFGCVVVSEVSDVFGIVLRCQKGQGWTTRTEIMCFLFGSDMVAGSWRVG